MRVAVIGSSGGMGSFFVRYFLSQGHTVSGSDVRRRRIASKRFSFFSSNARAVRNSDLILVASPIEATVRTVEESVPAMRRGATIVEISSVKGRIRPGLRRLLDGTGLHLLSVHPQFGPAMKVGSEMRMLVVGDEDGREMKMAEKIFPLATLIPVSEREHDRFVALSLSLTHLVNILYARIISKHMDPAAFRRISTPTSAVQLALAEGVLANDPKLYSYIQVENEASAEVILEMTRELKSLLRIVKARDRKSFERMYVELGGRYLGGVSRTEVLSRIYEAFDSAKE